MKQIPALLLLFLFSATAIAQVDWTWSNPTPQGNTLYDVALLDDGRGWAVGDYGTILFTPDGGSTWEAQFSGTIENLRTIQVLGAETLFTVGVNGTVLKSFDGGASWAAMSTAGSGVINDAFWLSETAGWVVGNGGLIRSTKDGAASWVEHESGTAEHLNGIIFVDASFGVAVGNSETILSTEDGGASWHQDEIDDAARHAFPAAEDIMSVDGGMIDGEPVVVAGGTRTVVLVRKGKGTKQWKKSGFGYGNRFRKVRIARVQPDPQFLVVGVTGDACQARIKVDIQTRDASVEWLPAPVNRVFYSYDYVGPPGFPWRGSRQDASTMVRVGQDGTIDISDDDGESWTPTSMGRLDPLHAIHASVHGVWAAGQRGIILFSATGEPPWSEQPLGAVSHTMHAVTFINASDGWAAGNNGRIYVTSNGGQSWALQASGTAVTLYSIFFANATTGWAVGREGTVLTTTNGGTTWTARPSGSNASLFAVSFGDEQTGWITSDGGLILASTDGGLTWSPQASGTTSQLRSVTAIDASTAVAVGIGGTVLRTANGGATWLAQESGTGAYLRSVRFFDANTGWAAGFGGTVIRTADGGDSWEVLGLPTNRNLNAVSFRSATDGFVAGEGGAILSTASGGGTSIETVARTADTPFAILAAFPNPTRNEGAIEIDVYVPGRIALHVYDLLGRRVAAIADDHLEAGRHRFTWSAAGTASGTYIYRATRDGYAAFQHTTILR